jgi:CelD/BcsL family acetyltransferase involved in cellulose biosynthesis
VRSAKTRQTLRKKYKALGNLGRVSFGLAAEPAGARQIVDQCLEMKSAQLARLGHWDPFLDTPRREFIIDYFGRNVGASTWAASLDIDGLPLATAFGFRHGSSLLLYQMAVGTGPGTKYSPGTLLLMNLVEHCAKENLNLLDLSLGDETYKYEWCDEHVKLFTTTRPLTAKGRLLGGLIDLRTKLRQATASRPFLYDVGKRLKRRLMAANVFRSIV